MSTSVLVTGASRGIGQVLLKRTPAGVNEQDTFSGRRSAGTWTQTDLVQPSHWPLVKAAVVVVEQAPDSGNSNLGWRRR